MIAQVAPVELNTIVKEPADLQGTSKQPTDTSFDTTLDNEEKKLQEKKSILSFVPWAQFQAALQAAPLTFTFEMKQNPIEGDVSKGGDHPRSTEAKEKTAELNSVRTDDNEASLKNRIELTVANADLIRNLAQASRHDIPVSPFTVNFSAIAEDNVNRPDMELLVSELVEKIRLVKEGEKTSLSLALKPDGLGQMLLSVSKRNGLISISITADAEAKKWFDLNIAALEGSLKQANINLGNLNIALTSGKKEFYQASDEFNAFVSAVTSEKISEQPAVLIDPFAYSGLFNVSSRLIYSKA